MSKTDISLKEPFQTVGTNFNKFYNTLSNNDPNDRSGFYFFIALLIVAFIVFLVISWIFYTLNKKGAACTKLSTIYKNIWHHHSVSFLTSNGNVKPEAKEINNPNNFFDDVNKSLIKNYYIKTAYNACCGDGYKNNFVNMCALEKCIQLGARCLDFEIYSYNGEPVVAASTANNNSIKETYNYIKLTDILNYLNNNSFNTSKTSCANDPMFLHFRIMSENKIIYDKFGDYIDTILTKNNLADIIKYNYKNPDLNNFLQGHIASLDFNKKFIIMVNTLHGTILDTSKLAKYVHIRSGTNSLRLLRYEKLVASGKNNSMLIDESHRSLIMVLPNIDNTLDNFDPLLAFNNGCQFVGMKFQNLDSKLQGYYKMFKDTGGFAFVLKSNNLRRDIIPPETPTPDTGPLRVGGGASLTSV